MATATWHGLKTTSGETLAEIREEFLAKTGVKVWVSRWFDNAVYNSALISDLMSQLAHAASAGADVDCAKPHFGFWDGRNDFRTEYPTQYGIEISTNTPSGVLKLMLRHAATASCPSGPCGIREERILWLEAAE